MRLLYSINLKNLVENRLLLIRHSRYLWCLTLIYSMLLVSENLFDLRLIRIFEINTGAGAILFPFTCLLSDMITEIYGYKNSRLVVWIGLFFSIIFIILEKIINQFPSPLYNNNQGFDNPVYFNARVIRLQDQLFLSYSLSRARCCGAGNRFWRERAGVRDERNI